MKIKKWIGCKTDKPIKIGLCNLKKDGGENMELVKRPCSVLQSIDKSFQQIKEFKEGKRQLKSLEESKQLWNKWIKEIERF